VGQLGNILAPALEGPRGPDLRHTVRVPTAALGREGGVWVEVPVRLEHQGARVPRRCSTHDRRGRVQLHLPATLTSGATIRLRGQGGLHEGGAAGDLYLTVEVVPRRAPWGWIAAGSLAALAAAAWALLG
jgi:hypothetical protein